MSSSFHRRLVAIMFTDVEGYTALMQRSEKAALDTRERHRQIFESITGKHHGEIIQYYGDGTLSIFTSAVEAVRCAREMQLMFRKEPAIPVRIGIHVGDILVSEDDIVGDGVNIAARLESVAASGSIVFSDAVRRDIANQDDLRAVTVGAFQFRNVAGVMEVFALSDPGLAVPAPGEIRRRLKEKVRPSAVPVASGSAKWAALTGVLLVLLLLGISIWTGGLWRPGHLTDLSDSEVPSLLVLPFANLGDDPGQNYLAEGIADEIRSKLSGIKDLRVVSRASSLYYNDKRLPVSRLSKELKVTSILEGTVQRSGEVLKVSVQLSDTKTDQLIWSSPAFQGHIADIFAIQEQIAREISFPAGRKLSGGDQVSENGRPAISR